MFVSFKTKETDNIDIDTALDRIFQRKIPVLHTTSLSTRIDDASTEYFSSFPNSIYDKVIFDPRVDDSLGGPAAEIQVMNRNARRPKKANKGARPCSHASRRRKKEKIGKRKR
jgi:hypothetical protein